MTITNKNREDFGWQKYHCCAGPLQALEELRSFMIVHGVALKEKQKLMRNMRVSNFCRWKGGGGAENAGVEKAGVDRTDGKCRSWKYRSDDVWKAAKHTIYAGIFHHCCLLLHFPPLQCCPYRIFYSRIFSRQQMVQNMTSLGGGRGPPGWHRPGSVTP